MTEFDAAVVGLGPAGRALTHRLAGVGARVLAIDPHPDRLWRHTLAGWARLLPGWLPAGCVGRLLDRPVLRAAAEYELGDRYAVLDNAALRAALDIGGAEVVEGLVGDEDLGGLRARARVVVDCRGARPAGHPGGAPAQAAHGVFLPADEGAAVLAGAEAVLMDWRPFDGAGRWSGPATFLYVLPMPDGRVLVEETCLAGQPAADQAELRRRLAVRLGRRGVALSEEWEVERVSIPLLRGGRRRAGVLRFGAAGAQGNPITGYSVFASLGAVDAVVRSVLAGAAPGNDSPDRVRRLGLRALLALDGADTYELFDAFGRLPRSAQRAVFTADGAQLAYALAQIAARLPWSTRIALARATALGRP